MEVGVVEEEAEGADDNDVDDDPDVDGVPWGP